MPPHAPSAPRERVSSSHSQRVHRESSLNVNKPQPTRPIPTGFLAACLLIALIESSIANHWLLLSDPVGLSWLFSKSAASSKAADADLLCLGDSLLKHGVVPSVITDTIGLSSINLAAARCPTLMSYYLFQQALQAGAHPKAILMNAKPAVLIGDPDYNTQYWPYAFTFQNLIDFAARTRRPQLIAATTLAQLFPSIRSRLQLRSSTRAALSGTTDTLHDVNPILWRNWTINAGANIAQSLPSFSGDLPSDVIEKLHPDRFYAHPSNRLAITNILQLAKNQGIHVYWLLPPISPPLQSLRDQSGAEDAYEQFIHAYQTKFPTTLTILDARRSHFANQHFVDSTHLNGHGAIALSSSLALVLSNDLLSVHSNHRSPWINLPPPTDQPTTSSVEDLDQSRAILGEARPSRSSSTVNTQQ